MLNRPLAALTPHTQTDPAALRDRLRAITAQGFAESEGGFEADVHSFALPLFDALGRCTGAISIAALATRVSKAQAPQIRAALEQAARTIITLWGGALPPAIHNIWTGLSQPKEPA